jgi:6-phosphogluconate dehydrogenase (decarboxylating)
MQLGLVGLGKMGFNMRERLRDGGHEVIGYDPRPDAGGVGRSGHDAPHCVGDGPVRPDHA